MRACVRMEGETTPQPSNKHTHNVSDNGLAYDYIGLSPHTFPPPFPPTLFGLIAFLTPSATANDTYV